MTPTEDARHRLSDRQLLLRMDDKLDGALQWQAAAEVRIGATEAACQNQGGRLDVLEDCKQQISGGWWAVVKIGAVVTFLTGAGMGIAALVLK